MELLAIFSLLGGLVILAVGGELLVHGASRLASSLGMSKLMIGLTVVAFGTSAPELAVSLFAALGGGTALAVGNVVGSNIANILLVLGLASLARPLTVAPNVLHLDGPAMILASTAFFGSAVLLSSVPVGVGLAFMVALVLYLYLTAKRSSSVPNAEPTPDNEAPARTELSYRGAYLGLVVVGLAGLTGGAQLIVYGASEIAANMGMSQRLIGMTVVAVGTSLPEIATCVVAARRGQSDIAIGNVIGSNLFNILMVMGCASIVAGGIPIEPAVLTLDLPVMLVATLLSLPVMISSFKIVRWEGASLLTLYVAYLASTIWIDYRA